MFPVQILRTRIPRDIQRLPGVSREEGLQQLLAVNIGALDWASFEEEIKHESPEERLLAPPWPVLDPAAYHGVLGQIARDIEPYSEADPTGILLQLLMMFGSTIGRRPFYAVEGTTHHCNLYSVLVGKTAQSRKGTSWGRALQVFNTIKEHPPIKGGLSSGEGLVDAVHDDIMKWIPETKKKRRTLRRREAGRCGQAALCVGERVRTRTCGHGPRGQFLEPVPPRSVGDGKHGLNDQEQSL